MRYAMRQILFIAVIISLMPVPAVSDEPTIELAPPFAIDMVCHPATIRASTELRVELPPSHGSDFAVIDPAGVYHFISFEPADSESIIQPPLPKDEFATMTVFRTMASALEGIPWTVEGVRGPIFKEQGLYRFVVARTLETEDPVLDGTCGVNFER